MLDSQITHEKNFRTYEIPTRKNSGPHETLTRKNFGPTKYTREKNWNLWKSQEPEDSRWHVTNEM